MSNIKGIIDNICEGEYVKAQELFNEEINERVLYAIDEVKDSIFEEKDSDDGDDDNDDDDDNDNEEDKKDKKSKEDDE